VLEQALQDSQWALICDRSVGPQDEGHWAFSVYWGGHELWVASGSAGYGQTSTDAKVFVIREALIYFRRKGYHGSSVQIFTDSQHTLHLIGSVKPTQQQSTCHLI
jgi:ribonuclease HI